MIIIFRDDHIKAVLPDGTPLEALASAYPEATPMKLDFTPNFVQTGDGFVPGQFATVQPSGFAEATGLELVGNRWVLPNISRIRWNERYNRKDTSWQRLRAIVNSQAFKSIKSPSDATDYVNNNVDTSSAASALSGIISILGAVIFVLVMLVRYTRAQHNIQDDDVFPDDE